MIFDFSSGVEICMADELADFQARNLAHADSMSRSNSRRPSGCVCGEVRYECSLKVTLQAMFNKAWVLCKQQQSKRALPN
jgi:hypothetical protein